jgi:glutamate racemase
MPAENILYFGDTARMPYGNKSAATVTQFVREIISYFEPHDPKHIVIACNTATALTLSTIRAEFPHLAMSGVIEPGARAAVEAAGNRPRPIIGVIGTEGTVRSRAYERAIWRRRHYATINSKAAPLLAPIVEEGRSAEDPLVKLALQQYLTPLAQRGMDVLVLGCTHYPVYRPLIEVMLGPAVTVIDSADKCAEDVQRRLRSTRLLREGTSAAGALRCFVTDDAARFSALASRFLGLVIEPPTWVSPDELRAAAAPTEVGLRPAI